MAAANGRAMKIKGSAFEREVVAFLRDHGHPYAERAYGAGRPGDVGDIDGVVGWTIEAKNHQKLNLAGWVDEAECERVSGRQPFAAVVAKRGGKPVGAAYVVMTLEQFAGMLADPENLNPGGTATLSKE
jgi:Holliday junction resolvase